MVDWLVGDVQFDVYLTIKYEPELSHYIDISIISK